MGKLWFSSGMWARGNTLMEMLDEDCQWTAVKFKTGALPRKPTVWDAVDPDRFTGDWKQSGTSEQKLSAKRC